MRATEAIPSTQGTGARPRLPHRPLRAPIGRRVGGALANTAAAAEMAVRDGRAALHDEAHRHKLALLLAGFGIFLLAGIALSLGRGPHSRRRL